MLLQTTLEADTWNTTDGRVRVRDVMGREAGAVLRTEPQAQARW